MTTRRASRMSPAGSPMRRSLASSCSPATTGSKSTSADERSFSSSKMSRLAKNVSANLLANAWSTALALLLTPWYVRLLGVESYGLIGFYVSWVAMVGILDTGISATALREIAWLWARPDERRQAGTLLRSLEAAYWGIMVVLGTGLLTAAWWFGAGWFKSAALAPDVVRQALLLMTG